MAFSTKYRLEYKDYFNEDWTILFQLDPFVGSEIDLTPGADPCSIVEEPSESGKYCPVVGSYADIQLVYESAIDELYTETSQEIKVLIYHGLTLIWHGFLSPGQYTRHFNQSKHYVTLTASVGLGELKEIKFRDGSDDPYYYQTTEILVLSNILGKTGLSLSIVDSVDIFEETYSAGTTNSPFAQTYLRQEAYYDEIKEESKDCYTVLVDILKKYGATIRQYGGQWVIYRMNSMNSTSTRYRVFLANGTYSSNSTYTAYRSLAQLGMTYMFADAELTKMKGVGSSEITVTPGLRQNFLKNGIFDDFTWSGGTPYYWSESGTPPNYNNTADSLAVTIGSNESSSLPTDYLTCSQFLPRVKSLRITLEYRAFYTGSPTHAKVLVVVTYGGYVLLSDGTWSSSAYPTSTGWLFDVTTRGTFSGGDPYEQLVIEPVEPPFVIGSGTGSYGPGSTLEVRLYQFYNETNPGVTTNYVQYRSILVDVEFDKSTLETQVYSHDGPNTIDNIDRQEIELADYIADGTYYTYDILNKITRESAGGNATQDWYIIGDSPTVANGVPIGELLAKQRAEGYSKSLDVLNATFRCEDTLITYRGIQDLNFTDEYGFSKTFCYGRVERDTRRGLYSGQWIECPVVYNDAGLDFASATYSSYTITANEIEVNSSSGAGVATMDAYTNVARETVRFVVVLVDDGSSDLPSIEVDGFGGITSRWGTTVINWFEPSAGTVTLTIGGDTGPGVTHNYTATVSAYYLTGI